MNGAKKFHSPDGPAFNSGEVWNSSSGSSESVTVQNVERWGVEKWDVDVYYSTESGQRNMKNAWSFQVRYEHLADRGI